jgi:hypothetical protein
MRQLCVYVEHIDENTVNMHKYHNVYFFKEMMK